MSIPRLRKKDRANLFLQKKIKRFTIVEMMVVAAVIAILASIIIPSVLSGINKAKKFDCMSNLRQVSIGFNLYRKDHQKYPMPTWFLDDFTPINTYIKSTAIFDCKGQEDIKVTQPSQLNGGTPFLRHMDLTDMEDWELSTSSKNDGGGNNPYGLDPSNNQFPRWIAGKLKIEGLHDLSIDHHGSYNFIIMDKGSYMPVYSEDQLWILKSNRHLQKN